MVKIIGLGPSGAALGFLLGSAEVEERVGRYFKACGEAVPVETPLISREFVVDKVRRYRFFLGDRLLGEVSYREPRWYIIEKGAWIDYLRSRIGPGSSDGVVVDARGPYGSKGKKIVVVMAYVSGIRREEETVDFIFPRNHTGFYWIFPHGSLYNIGGGFLEVEDPTALVREFANKLGGRIINIKGAPLTVLPEIDLGYNGRFRVGESAGLIYPLTGEGIRPGVLSAIALAEALRTKNPLETYRRRVEPIVKQIGLQKRLLLAASAAIKRGGSISAIADGSLLRDYIEENLSLRGLFVALAKRPAAAARLLSALLRR